MTYEAALNKSRHYQKSWPRRIILKYISQRVGHQEVRETPQAFWKGLEHFNNVCGAYHFNFYKDDIEAGTMVVGPTLYTTKDAYHFLPDCVGLYHAKEAK